MNKPIDSIIRRYAEGQISATQAAGLLGETATVADVFVMLRGAGLEPPRPSPEQERAELVQARSILGFN